jgi:hypothetical protein
MARRAVGVAGMKRARLLFGGAALAWLVALGLMLSVGAGSAFASAPDPPTGVSAAATDGQAAVSFTAAANDGGSAITGYTVTAAPGGRQASGTASPITVTGLTDGTAYTFTVTATNGATSVASSPSASATPLAPPTASGALTIGGTAEVGDQVTAPAVTWSEADVTIAYQWFACASANECVANEDATNEFYEVGPFDGGFELEVEVSATNADGETGTATSTPTTVVTAQPGAPVAQDAAVLSGPVDGSQAVSVTNPTWKPAPTPVYTYEYEWLSCSPDLSSWTRVGGDSPSYTPIYTDAGNVLVAAVAATNSFGQSVASISEPSAPVTFPPPTVTITAPTQGNIYALLVSGQAADIGPQAEYSCAAPTGMILESCTGTVPNQSPFPNAGGRPYIHRDRHGCGRTDGYEYGHLPLRR